MESELLNRPAGQSSYCLGSRKTPQATKRNLTQPKYQNIFAKEQGNGPSTLLAAFFVMAVSQP
jgi:hypothetical protein